MPVWWNWYTRRIQNPLPSGVAVQVRLPVPYSRWSLSCLAKALFFLGFRTIPPYSHLGYTVIYLRRLTLLHHSKMNSPDHIRSLVCVLCDLADPSRTTNSGTCLWWIEHRQEAQEPISCPPPVWCEFFWQIYLRGHRLHRLPDVFDLVVGVAGIVGMPRNNNHQQYTPAFVHMKLFQWQQRKFWWVLIMLTVVALPRIRSEICPCFATDI